MGDGGIVKESGLIRPRESVDEAGGEEGVKGEREGRGRERGTWDKGKGEAEGESGKRGRGAVEREGERENGEWIS